MNRILWLIADERVWEAEAPCLKELDIELYVPQIKPLHLHIIEYKNDDSTLPLNVQEQLNEMRFYDTTLSRNDVELLNQYFNMVIFEYDPQIIQSLVFYFRGNLLYRPLKLIDLNSFRDKILRDKGLWLLLEIEKLDNRFMFLVPAENNRMLNDIAYQNREYVVPFMTNLFHAPMAGISPHKKLLFICEGILFDEAKKKVYDKFRIDFKGMKFCIAGKQPIEVKSDNTVWNYIDDQSIQQCRAIFFYEVNTYEEFYWFHRALSLNIPIIYMKGGLLNQVEMYGACITLVEAKKKCKRVLQCSYSTRMHILNSQNKALTMLEKQRFFDGWNQVLSVQTVERKRRKKLGLILPTQYTGGVLDYSIRLALAIKRASVIMGDELELVFGHLRHKNYDNRNYFRKLEEAGIEIREFVWEVFDEDRISTLSALQGYPLKPLSDTYILPNDGVAYFEDCDFLLFTADRVQESTFLRRPYGVIVHDYIQRYISSVLPSREVEKGYLELSRGAVMNFTTTQVMVKEYIQYAGGSLDQIRQIPLFFDRLPVEEYKDVKENLKKYFIWSTNCNMHKRHKIVLEALKEYYKKGGQILCYMTGADTEKFDVSKKAKNSDDYIDTIRDIIDKSKELKKYIKVKGLLPKEEYYSVLKNAQWFLHIGLADNGNGTAFDAAMFGVPTVSSDYPAMRNMNEKFGLNMHFFNGKEAGELAKLLLECESKDIKQISKLPSTIELERHTIESNELCTQIYKVIKNNTNI